MKRDSDVKRDCGPYSLSDLLRIGGAGSRCAGSLARQTRGDPPQNSEPSAALPRLDSPLDDKQVRSSLLELATGVLRFWSAATVTVSVRLLALGELFPAVPQQPALVAVRGCL